MKTIDVRILVRNDIDPAVALEQLVKGVIRIHGAAELVPTDAPRDVYTHVARRPNVAWNGEEVTGGA